MFGIITARGDRQHTEEDQCCRLDMRCDGNAKPHCFLAARSQGFFSGVKGTQLNRDDGWKTCTKCRFPTEPTQTHGSLLLSCIDVSSHWN
jgi:hypothetical protein